MNGHQKYLAKIHIKLSQNQNEYSTFYAVFAQTMRFDQKHVRLSCEQNKKEKKNLPGRGATELFG